jgi:putative alpha-1,2-mannosidase
MQLNLLKEAKDMSFDTAKRNALKTWNSELGRILAEGAK